MVAAAHPFFISTCGSSFWQKAPTRLAASTCWPWGTHTRT